MGTTACFIAVAFAWIFFRANNVNDAFTIIGKVFTDYGPAFQNLNVFVYGLLGLSILAFKDIKDNYGYSFSLMHSNHVFIRYISTICLILYILLFGSFSSGQFIYFQF